MEHYLTFGTTSGHFGPSDNLFRGQKAGFGTISLIIKGPFEGLLMGPNALHFNILSKVNIELFHK